MAKLLAANPIKKRKTKKRRSPAKKTARRKVTARRKNPLKLRSVGDDVMNAAIGAAMGVAAYKAAGYAEKEWNFIDSTNKKNLAAGAVVVAGGMLMGMMTSSKTAHNAIQGGLALVMAKGFNDFLEPTSELRFMDGYQGSGGMLRGYQRGGMLRGYGPATQTAPNYARSTAPMLRAVN